MQYMTMKRSRDEDVDRRRQVGPAKARRGTGKAVVRQRRHRRKWQKNTKNSMEATRCSGLCTISFLFAQEIIDIYRIFDFL